jgi:LCP family protein required for cell wall assembly
VSEQLRDRSNRAPRPVAPARHGRLKHSRAWKTILGIVGTTLAVVLVSGASVGAIAVAQLESNIETVQIQADTKPAPPTLAAYEGGFNILLVGSDTREGQDGIGGTTKEAGATLNDVNMIMHVAQDQKSAVVVSIPRDMVVPLPKCENGGPAQGQPINTTLYYGGVPCAVATVEKLTDLRIDFAGMITFQGVISMSNAVGGVDVCITEPLFDPYTGIDLPTAGTHTLMGFDALAFLRSRHGVGDGSDLGRIGSQQVFLSSLVRKIKDDGTLTDLTKLYPLATAATQNITLSENFKKLDTLVSIAMVLKNIPLENIIFVQYPSRTGGTGIYAGKVQPIDAQADALFEYLRNDVPFQLDAKALDGAHGGSTIDPNAPTTETPDPSASPDPSATPETPAADLPVLSGVKGQSAATRTCSVSNN